MSRTCGARSGEWRKERGTQSGRFGIRKRLLSKISLELQSIREPQWCRRREGRTLLCRGGECRNTFLGVLCCLTSSKDPPRAWKNPPPVIFKSRAGDLV